MSCDSRVLLAHGYLTGCPWTPRANDANEHWRYAFVKRAVAFVGYTAPGLGKSIRVQTRGRKESHRKLRGAGEWRTCRDMRETNEYGEEEVLGAIRTGDTIRLGNEDDPGISFVGRMIYSVALTSRKAEELKRLAGDKGRWIWRERREFCIISRVERADREQSRGVIRAYQRTFNRRFLIPCPMTLSRIDVEVSWREHNVAAPSRVCRVPRTLFENTCL